MARQSLLKTTHRTVLDVASLILNVDTDQLEEGVVDKDEYIQVLSDFFVKNGRRVLIIYYQSMSPPEFGINFHSINLVLYFVSLNIITSF